MNYKKLEIPEVILFQPSVFRDERGYFMESFNENFFGKILDKTVNFCQDNESMSSKGVFRGLHFQDNPYSQSKLVRVISGSVIDFIIDIRKDSPTFKKHLAIKISAKNKKQIFIPKGFAHGFLSLEDNTIFSYKVDHFYSKDHDTGINIHDPSLNINLSDYFDGEIIISEKDQSLNFLT
jgi:dTDP-4-dehydrorhamnose 3,5-epimerase